MALTNSELALSADILSLKARVDAEMKRRCRNGDLSSYATNNAYTISPGQGEQVYLEHINKILNEMNAITTQSYELQDVGNMILSPSSLATALTTYEKEAMTQNAASSCKSSCSGLCVSGCWNACTGCTGSCTGSCTGGCSGSCKGSCKGGCNSGCWGACGYGFF